MSRRVTLPIAAPCPEASRLTGDGVALHCERCDKAVYDLSAMTQAQARVLLRAFVGRPKPCVRYRVDTRGDILFRRPVTPSPQGWAAAVAAGAVIALTAGPSAAMSRQPTATEPAPASAPQATSTPSETPTSCPLPDPALPDPALPGPADAGEVLGGVPPQDDDYYDDGNRSGKHRRWLRRQKRKERRAKRKGHDLAALD